MSYTQLKKARRAIRNLTDDELQALRQDFCNDHAQDTAITRQNPAYTGFLEARYKDLQKVNKRLTETLQNEGRLTIIYADDMNSVQDAYSGAQVKEIVQNAVHTQYQNDQKLGRAMVELGSNLAAVQAAAGCNNGKDTTRMLKNVSSDLLASLDRLDEVLKDLETQPNTEVEWDEFNAIMDGAKTLWQAVKTFDGTEDGKKQLEAYIAQHNPRIATLIRSTSGRRGAPVKGDDWLTVEYERGLSELPENEQTAAKKRAIVDAIYETLSCKSYDKLTPGEKTALQDITASGDVVAMLDTRIRRKMRKNGDKLFLSRHLE